MEMVANKMKVEKYENYKDSGVEWIKDVPDHWGIIKLKRLFQEKKKITNVDLPCGSISFGKVVYKDDDKVPAATKKSYQAVSKGEYLLNPLNLNYDLISLRIALSDKDVVVSSGYIVLKPIVKLDKNYFKWFLHRYDVAFMKTLGSGVRQTINFSNIGDSELIFPPLSEQTVIANFLDKKCQQLNQAIAQKERLIELLKERKQILIQNAVTKGLDPTVKMKDSGVEWIGEVPEGWEVMRLKIFIKDLESGVSVNASESESVSLNEIGVLKTSSVYTYSFNHKENKKVFKSDLRRVRCPVRANSIIISRMNAPDLVGASGYVEKDYPCLFLPDRLWQTVFSKKYKIDVFWLSLVIKTKGFRHCITAISNGSSPSMKNISKGDFLNLKLVFPPYTEQKNIAELIEKKSKEIDTSISLQQIQIQKLKEYKSTLINSAVTGKIKVV